MIGVGTEHGDDSAGLAVAARLRRGPLPANVDVVDCPRPGLDLLDELSRADAVVLIDATRSGEPTGTVRRIPLESLRTERGYSSHGLGVAEALELAGALGRMPRRLEIVGIEGHAGGETAPCQTVARGIEAAVQEVRALVVQLDGS